MRNPFTHKKLTEVKDSATEFGYADVMEARFAGEDFEAEQSGFSFYRIKPNKRQPFAHRHEEAEEVYVVLRGRGRLKLDDEVIEVEELDAIRVAPEVTRAWEAGDDGLAVLVFGSRHEGDGELFHGWWSD